MKVLYQFKCQMKIVSNMWWANSINIAPTMITRRLVVLIAITALFALLSIPPANAQDLVRVIIPASACTPVSPSSHSLIRIVNGAYTFLPDRVGTATFYCPLPLDSSSVPRQGSTNFEMLYRDTDGTENLAFVRAVLQSRNASELLPNVSDEIDSSSSSVTSNTSICTFFNHTFQDNLYFFRVTMRRGNTSQDPAFSGIIFNSCDPG